MTALSNEAAPKGFVWEARKDDQCIYFAGSIHSGSKTIPSPLVEVMEKVKRVYFETELTAPPGFFSKITFPFKSFKRSVQSGMALGYVTKRTQELTDEEKERAPQQIVDAFNYNFPNPEDTPEDDEECIKEFQTCLEKGMSAAALVQAYLGAYLEEQGHEKHGLELAILKNYKRGKSFYGLEKPSEHIYAFAANILVTFERIIQAFKDDQLTEFITREKQFLEKTLDNYKKGKFKSLKKDYKKYAEDVEVPNLRERNLIVINQLDKIALKPSLVVNGIFHFMGQDGLISLMEERGWSVTRIKS